MRYLKIFKSENKIKNLIDAGRSFAIIAETEYEARLLFERLINENIFWRTGDVLDPYNTFWSTTETYYYYNCKEKSLTRGSSFKFLEGKDCTIRYAKEVL